jgi:hypothetical protein
LEEGPWRNLNRYCKKLLLLKRKSDHKRSIRLEMVCRLNLRYTLFYTKIVPPFPLYFEIQSKIMTRLYLEQAVYSRLCIILSFLFYSTYCTQLWEKHVATKPMVLFYQLQVARLFWDATHRPKYHGKQKGNSIFY